MKRVDYYLEDIQESLVGPPFKNLCKNDIVIRYDHVKLWYDHTSLFAVEPC
jgi:hypothetical protein